MSASEKRSLISGKAAPEEAEGAGVVAAFIQLLQGKPHPAMRFFFPRFFWVAIDWLTLVQKVTTA